VRLCDDDAASLGVVLHVDEGDTLLPFYVHEDALGRSNWMLAHAVGWIKNLAHDHSGAFRVPNSGKGKSFAVLGPRVREIKLYCDEHCKHIGGAFQYAHWECCGQRRLQDKCRPFDMHPVGTWVTHTDHPDFGRGCVVKVDPSSRRRSYFVMFENGTSEWFGAKSVRVHAGEQPAFAEHTGEFRASKNILFGPHGDADWKPREFVRYFCSTEDKADGMLCSHKAAGDKLKILPQSHWSCCGGSLFAKTCKFDKNEKADDKTLDKLMLDLLHLIGEMKKD
jgi:hypothetical protein